MINFQTLCFKTKNILNNKDPLSKLIKKTAVFNASEAGSKLKIQLISQDIFQSCKPNNYVEPLKKDFNSLRDLLRYGRSRATSALKGENPYEHLIIINPKTKKVLGEYKGNINSVDEGFIARMNTPKEAIIIHGHPTTAIYKGKKITAPVSFSDAISIEGRGKEIYAFNELGEYSLLRKKPGFRPLTEDKIKYYENLYDEFTAKPVLDKIKSILGSYLPEELSQCKSASEYISKLEEFFLKNPQLKNEIMQNTSKETVAELRKYFTAILSKKPNTEMIKTVHEFWKKYAGEMGFIYRTNYSYLK